MSGRAAHRFAAFVLVAVAASACRGEEVDDSRPAASPAAGATTSAPAGATTSAPADRPLGELPVPRTEVAGATLAGRLVVAGGLTPDGAASALVHTYDASATRWDEAPSLPVPLHHAGMAAVGGRVYVVGGYTNGAGQPWRALAGMWSLGPAERSWREEPPLPGGARGALGAAAAAGLLVAAGGVADGAVLGRTEVFDPGLRAWRAGPALALPREHLAVASGGGRVYAIAGRAGSLDNFRAVQSLDPVGDTAWRDEPDVADARGGTAAAEVDGRVCVAGGEEAAGTIASVECLDGDGWVRAARLARPRHGLAVVGLDGRLHVVGGGEQPGLFVSGAHEAFDL